MVIVFITETVAFWNFYTCLLQVLTPHVILEREHVPAGTDVLLTKYDTFSITAGTRRLIEQPGGSEIWTIITRACIMEQTSCSVDGRYRRYAIPNYYQIIAVIPRPAVKVFHESSPEYKLKSEIIVTETGFAEKSTRC